MNIVLNIVFVPIYIAWRIFAFVTSLLKKAFFDVLMGVYGKFVALLSGLLFLGMLGFLVALFTGQLQ